MLDRLIEEAARRFDLGDQAGPLVEHLLAMITDRDHGRIEGFLAAFREEGMGRQVDSWVAEGPGAKLSGPEVEAGLGPGLVEEIAQRFGLEAVNVAAALGFFIPRALDALTPGGEVPGDELLLARVEALRAAAETGAAPESARVAVPGPPQRAAAHTETPPASPPVGRPTAPSTRRHAEPPSGHLAAAPDTGPEETFRRIGVLGWLLPLIVLLAVIWWAVRQCAPQPDPAPPAAADSTPSEVAGPPPRVGPGAASPPGPRASGPAAARRALTPGPRASGPAAARQALTPGPRASGPAAARQALTPGASRKRSAAAGRSGSGVNRQPTGRALAQAPEAQRRQAPAQGDGAAAPAVESAPDRAAQPDAATPPFDPAATSAAAQQEGREALAALAPDFTTEELVMALNRGRIDFAPSSAAIPPAARSTLEDAATAILALPSGTRLEIAGHTDGSGEPRRNQRLSQARAEAVRNVLVDFGVPAMMLVPRGYGASRPVASNASAEGRLRNRRIEFAVIE